MIIRTLAIASVIMPLGISAALAQTTTDVAHMAHLQSANQLGVLEYCQKKGYTDQAAVDAQKKSNSMLPASTDTSGIADAESTGKDGTFLVNGSKTTLDQMASGKSTTVKDLCAQLGTNVKNVVAQMGAMQGGMPTVPGGMKMPAMPNGMQMPSMGTTPATR